MYQLTERPIAKQMFQEAQLCSSVRIQNAFLDEGSVSRCNICLGTQACRYN